MQISQLLFPRDDSSCVQCTSSPPPCNCAADEQCIQVSQSCTACAHFQCVAATSSSGSGGVSAGAVAGAVIGVLVFAAIAVGAYLYWRRRQHAKLAAADSARAEAATKDVPAPAETVLRRPDPSEKPASSPPPARMYSFPHAQLQQQQQQQLQQHLQQQQPETVRVYDHGTDVIDLDPAAVRANIVAAQNPFGDAQSIVTTSTGSQQTNVIPIALVPPGTLSPVHTSSSGSISDGTNNNGHIGNGGGIRASTASSELVPPRPLRSPNMDHLAFSRDPSPVSDGADAGSGVKRASAGSYVTNASFASDLDAVIVTQPSRQVRLGLLGVGNAAVVRTPPARSPLATATAFGPGSTPASSEGGHGGDEESVVRRVDREGDGDGDPFGDAHERQYDAARSSRATLGTTIASFSSDAHDDDHLNAHTSSTFASRRPASSLTQAASVIGAELVGATRVQLDYSSSVPSSYTASPSAAASFLPSPLPTPATASSTTFARSTSVRRMTAARLVPSTPGLGTPTYGARAGAGAGSVQTPTFGSVQTPTSTHALMSARSPTSAHSPTSTRPPDTARTPGTAASSAVLERQQERAMREVQAARSAASVSASMGSRRRGSFETMASGVSARADSILEGFPFVPPSPIAGRPPRSPLAQYQQEQAQQYQREQARYEQEQARYEQEQSQYQQEQARYEQEQARYEQERGGSPLLPPNRRVLGMSTGSELSNVSTGLGSFPFEIDHGSMPLPADVDVDERSGHANGTGHVSGSANMNGSANANGSASGNGNGKPARVRASLDTLALTSDLASYPLGFDRPPMP